jgi:hypothetical protein
MERLCLSDKKIKHISELTPDELFKQLEIASSNDITELQSTQVEQSPVLDFIYKFEIKSGKYPVPVKPLIFLYRKTTTDKYIKEAQFLTQLRMYFKVKDNMIFLNHSAFHFHCQLEKFLNKKRRPRLTTEAFTKHVIQFLDDTGIKKGPTPVPVLVLYHIYREYCARKQKTPMAKMNFKLLCEKLWDKTETQYGVSYLVNNKGDLYHVKKYKQIQEIYEKKHKREKTIKRKLKKIK